MSAQSKTHRAPTPLLQAALFIVIGTCTALQAQEGQTDPGYYRAPSEGGARRLQSQENDQIALYASPDPASDILAMLPADTGLANLGCETIDQGLWCHVRTLHSRVQGYSPGAALTPVVGPDGTIATGVDDSRRRAARKRFDATTTAPCAQEQGQALGICDIGIARSGGGDATVSATFPNGFSRLLFFVQGDFTRGNSTMSGVGTDVDWQVQDDVHLIRVDDQRFEIPVAFVLGQ